MREVRRRASTLWPSIRSIRFGKSLDETRRDFTKSGRDSSVYYLSQWRLHFWEKKKKKKKLEIEINNVLFVIEIIQKSIVKKGKRLFYYTTCIRTRRKLEQKISRLEFKWAPHPEKTKTGRKKVDTRIIHRWDALFQNGVILFLIAYKSRRNFLLEQSGIKPHFSNWTGLYSVSSGLKKHQ